MGELGKEIEDLAYYWGHAMDMKPIECGNDHQGVGHGHVLHVQVENTPKYVHYSQQEDLQKGLLKRS
jgi:hypothetical protein